LRAAFESLRPPAERSAPMSRVRRWHGAGVTRALRNVLWLFGDKVFAVVVGLAVFGLIARHHGPEASGHFAYATALLQVGLGLALVCSAGPLMPRLSRTLAVPGLIANAFALRLAASLLSVAVLAGMVVLTVDDPQRRQVALLLLLCVPLIEPFNIASAYWQSLNRNAVPVVSRSAGLVVRAAVVMAAVLAGAPLWVAALAWCAESAVAALVQLRSLHTVAPPTRWPGLVTRWRAVRLLAFGAPFLLGACLSQLFLRLDRLVLAEWMPVREYGHYAVGMQLVDVWLQVAIILGIAIGPAFMYERVRRARSWREHVPVALGLAAVGAAGLVGAALLGPWLLKLVFGAGYEASYPYLVAGCAFGVLCFVDQLVQLVITAKNQPMVLALKWAVAVVVAVLVQWTAFAALGPFAGPAGLAIGMVAGWLAVMAAHRFKGVA
jgi:polysaccharide transporter, PST family